MHPQRERIKELIKAISAGIYERDEAISLALLSAVAGESIFLLGLPGVGKSLIGRRLKLAFHEASSFEYLMSRFSTPDEIFGPVSISKLKDEDTYERIIEGYLPAADIVFLDEIWKAGPSIQNALLTVLNEKIYRNGRSELRLPLKGIIAASNELPAENEGMEALWDRFLVRMILNDITDKKHFCSMIATKNDCSVNIDHALQITPTEYCQWQESSSSIIATKDILEFIWQIRERIADINREQEGDDQRQTPIIISDRRWKKIINLLRYSAMLNGRDNINVSDMFIITKCIWNDDCQQDTINGIVCNILSKSALAPWYARLNIVINRSKELKDEVVRHSKDEPIVYDGKYFNIVGLNKGRSLISIEEYDSLSTYSPCGVHLSAIEKTKNEGTKTIHVQQVDSLKTVILKVPGGVEVNGQHYRLERSTDLKNVNDHILKREYNELMTAAKNLLADFKQYSKDIDMEFDENLFMSERMHQLFNKPLSEFIIEINKCISKLLVE